MEEIKSNSNKSKSRARNDSKLPEKRAEKIISGAAKTKKKSELRKLADIFIPEDVQDIRAYIMSTILIPAAKKAIVDVVDIFLYGETGSSSGRRKTPGERVSYNNCYGGRNNRRESDSQRTRAVYEYDDIFFDTRGEADAVLTGMDEVMDSYDLVRVADMFDLAGITPPFTANDYGWYDIQSAKIVRVKDGYMIKMPKAVPLD